MTHLAFVVANYPPRTGGVELHVARLAREFTTRGTRVTVFSMEAQGSRIDSEGIPVIGMGRYADLQGVLALPDPHFALGLAIELQDRGVAAVSVHTRFFPSTWLGIWAARRAGVPSLLTEHGGGHVAAPNPVIRGTARLVDLTAGRWAWRAADAVLAVSARSATFIRDAISRNVTVCGNGIDAGFWGPKSPFVDEQRLSFVGRLVAEKGWHDFVDLVGQLPEPVSADILGDGPDLPKVRRYIQDSNVPGRFRILGKVDPATVRQHLRGSVLFNPSRAAEGFQMTLLEGAIAGARVVTTDVGVAKEVARMGSPVWIVNTADREGVKSALEDALITPWQAPRGTDRYSWRQVADVYERTLEGCL